jgi:predicted NAD/FAD-dependent oxidoreductase
MESLSQHLSTDLSIAFESMVERVVRNDGAYHLYANDNRELGVFDIVLWNCPPLQTLKQLPSECGWRERLYKVEMVPCWAVMIGMKRRWEIPFDGAFVNQGMLSWIARDSSKPTRPQGSETWVLHSTIDWAKDNLEATQEWVVSSLIKEAERVAGSIMPAQCIAKAHRWLYSRPAEALPESALWDDDNWLGACGDWCGGPRIEGALKSGVSLAGRVLGTLHENPITASRQSSPRQLTLFNELVE